jgi:hypothetical protein
MSKSQGQSPYKEAEGRVGLPLLLFYLLLCEDSVTRLYSGRREKSPSDTEPEGTSILDFPVSNICHGTRTKTMNRFSLI